MLVWIRRLSAVICGVFFQVDRCADPDREGDQDGDQDDHAANRSNGGAHAGVERIGGLRRSQESLRSSQVVKLNVASG